LWGKTKLTPATICHRVRKRQPDRTQARDPQTTVLQLYQPSYMYLAAYTSSLLNSEQFWTLTFMPPRNFFGNSWSRNCNKVMVGQVWIRYFIKGNLFSGNKWCYNETYKMTYQREYCENLHGQFGDRDCPKLIFLYKLLHKRVIALKIYKITTVTYM
jgi:hypothetical protein